MTSYSPHKATTFCAVLICFYFCYFSPIQKQGITVSAECARNLVSLLDVGKGKSCPNLLKALKEWTERNFSRSWWTWWWSAATAWCMTRKKLLHERANGGGRNILGPVTDDLTRKFHDWEGRREEERTQSWSTFRGPHFANLIPGRRVV